MKAEAQRLTIGDSPQAGLGYDELNLAEFPLASVSHRFLDGAKTVVMDGRAWDRDKKEFVDRKLTISGSDRYGLPTAIDDDVLLACIQLSAANGFSDRRVEFTRYELLKLLHWNDETKNYQRLATSLRRWKGVTVYSNRAFFDRARESWVNRDFGIFDNLVIYERENWASGSIPARSWFLWNEVLFQSFQSGYLKRLDWDLYLSLKSPVAKRLYRFLDKRFFHASTVEIDLHELGLKKVRLSANYNVAQMKRELMKGIRELETRWKLVPLDAGERFVLTESGRWRAVFHLHKRPKAREQTAESNPVTGPEAELVQRGIGKAIAQRLVANCNLDTVSRMIRLFDWYNATGNPRGVGFLVNSLKNPERISIPVGFEQLPSRADLKPFQNSRKSTVRKLNRNYGGDPGQLKSRDNLKFRAFIDGLTAAARTTFENEAIAAASPFKRSGLARVKDLNSELHEAYLESILREYFALTKGRLAG